MIIDNIRNTGLYIGLGERFATALDYLKTVNLKEAAPGKYVIRESEIYVNISEYNTIDENEGKAEAHKKYADIQFLIFGEEKIGVEDIHHCEPVGEYEENKDVQFFRGNMDFKTLRTGDFAILFPDDVHMPKCRCGESSSVKKAIVKVLLG